MRYPTCVFMDPFQIVPPTYVCLFSHTQTDGYPASSSSARFTPGKLPTQHICSTTTLVHALVPILFSFLLYPTNPRKCSWPSGGLTLLCFCSYNYYLYNFTSAPRTAFARPSGSLMFFHNWDTFLSEYFETNQRLVRYVLY